MIDFQACQNMKKSKDKLLMKSNKISTPRHKDSKFGVVNFVVRKVLNDGSEPSSILSKFVEYLGNLFRQ